MRSNLKLTSFHLLRQLVQAQSCAIDSEDPFALHAMVWLGFSCNGCDQKIPLSPHIYQRTEEPPQAADQARAQGWVVEADVNGRLTSRAFCPSCSASAVALA
jgi:hypothetical protein